MGLGPFAGFIRSSGKVGQILQIFGQGFTGTNSVPVRATTGFVTVATPSDTLKSNEIFRVMPQIFGFSPASGPAGTKVVITGESFTGTIVVTYACKWQMSFTVDSDTPITAILPARQPSETTGTIAIRTPGGRVDSTARFTVTP